MNPFRIIALALSTLTLGVSVAQASTISYGINFVGRTGSSVFDMLPSEVAGVVEHANWNNYVPAGDTLNWDNGSKPGTTAALTDNTGDASAGVTLSYAGAAGSNDRWHTSVSGSDHSRMLDGVLKRKGGKSMTFTFNNLDLTKTYDLYFYGPMTDDVGKSTTMKGAITQGTGDTTTYFANHSNPNNANSGAVSDYERITSTTSGTAQTFANSPVYMLWEDLTPNVSGEIEVKFETANGQAVQGMGVTGIQLVVIPEPASLALMGLGGFCLLPRPRR